MSSFLSLNLQDFDLHDDISDSVKTTNVYCVCCLDRNTVFLRLHSCNHAGYLDHFIKPEVHFSNPFICSHCHAQLKKIFMFKKQVEESFRILSAQSAFSTPQHNHIRSPLKLTEVNHMDLVEDHPLKKELAGLNESIKKELLNISEPIVTIHEEVEPSNLLSTLNKTVKTTAKKKKGKLKLKAGKEPPPKARKQTKEPMYKRFEGKIKMVQLSEEEMREERERDANSDSYLKLPYKCAACVVGFDHEANYRDHCANRHEPRDGCVTCTICNSVLAAGSSFRKHTKNHFTRYDCEACGKRYISLYSIMQHYNTAHGAVGLEYKCQHCEFTTDLISAFTYHRNKHRSNLKCTECNKQCSSNANLKTHLFAVHKKSDRQYICVTCEKRYNTKSGLQHHASTAHAAPPPRAHYCAPCDAHFNSLRCYRAHLRLSARHVTESERRYSCAECARRFITSTSLRRHVEWVHLKQFKHVCPQCCEGFRTPTLLKRHDMQVHQKIAPERNKICHYCGKAFTTTQILRTHIRTHTGERPLQCTLCSATFAHNGALYTHTKLIHRQMRST